ncbi:MAG: hypothetical protein KF773_22305 [Deltaproteobacteria bacterium]|nr:hypothetical protein [Deltaproteobacteria bacterium]
MTVLELMIVIAILGMLLFLLRAGLRVLTKADLVENATEMATLLKRTSDLAIENGEMHRVVIDMEKGLYTVEVCHGATTIFRNEQVRNDDPRLKDKIDRGKERLSQLPQDALAAGDPDEATKRASAVAGHHVADRQCQPVQGGVSGIAVKEKQEDEPELGEWTRRLSVKKGIKFKEVWVQHQTDSSTKGQVAIFFFPVGSAEKAVIEITDDSDTFTVLVHGLTGRVELRDGRLRDVDDHMMRNAMGDKDAKREGDK